MDRLEMNLLLPQWDLLDEQLEAVEAKIAERAAADEQVQLLESMPGLGHYSAVAIASRIGSIERFKRPDSLANYFGLTPGCRNSGEATQRLGFDHQAGQQDRPLPARASRRQGAAIRRRDAGMVQADQEASRGKDWRAWR